MGRVRWAHHALASVHYFRRELGAFRQAADRVLSLNPRDPFNLGYIGILIAYSGDWPRGLEIVDRATRLNPHHAGWLHFARSCDHYRRREYEQALRAAERIDMPEYDWVSLFLAATCAQLGLLEAAKAHLETVLRIGPELARNPRLELRKWYVSEELVDHVLDGLRKAGLEITDDDETAPEVVAPAESRQPFVGRQTEFDKLVARLDALAGGAGTLVLLGGEPGVGKTRLSEELLTEARQRGMVVLTGHCYEEGQAPFALFVEILEQLLRKMPGDVLRQALGEDAADLARLAPKIRVVLDDVPDPAVLEPEQQRRVLFNAVLDLFRRLTERQPVVLLLDDLHWADEATVGLLQHLTPHLSTMRLLGLGTYRDVELDVGKPFEKAMATLVRQKQAVRVPVRRLPETAVAELLSALGGSAPPDALVEAIFHETEGNPFFIGEVFQHLSEEGKLFEDAEAGVWKTDLTVDELDVPEGVRLVVGRRLERLNDATPTLLTAAAVVGRRFDLTLVEALSDLDSDPFLAAIEEAEAAKLIASERTGRETTYVFTHELVRSTLLGALSLPRRQRLHARVAETMEAVYASDLTTHASAMARHLYEAGAAADETKTISYLTLAADQALETGAFEGALHDVELALSLATDDDQASRAGLLWKRGLARRSLGEWPAATEDWQAALPLYEMLADRGGIVTVCKALVYVFLHSDQPQMAVSTARRGLGALGPEASTDRCVLEGNCAWALGQAGELEEGDHAFRQALAMADALQERRLRGEILSMRMWFFHHCGRGRDELEASREAVELLRPTGDIARAAEALAVVQMASVFVGHPQDVTLTEEETRTLAERLGLFAVRMVSRGSEPGRDWVTTPDLDAADVGNHEFLTVATRIGGGISFWAVASQAQAALWRGRLAEARTLAADASAHDQHATVYEGIGWGTLFLCECRLGHTAAAMALLDERPDGLPRAGVLNSFGRWWALFKVVEGLVTLGERDRAAALHPLMLEAIATGTVVALDTHHLLETVAGIAAAAGRQWDAAETHYQSALRLADEMPFVSEQAEARYWLARMLVDRDESDDRQRAQELLETALKVYKRIGMPWHIERAEELAADAAG